MDLPGAIVRSITEASGAKGLSAMNIRIEQDTIQWNSKLGSLGRVKYRVPFAEFEKSLEDGMRHVSILIAFADLIIQEKNRGMIDNMYEAGRRGSTRYFWMNSTRKNVMNMCVPVASNSHGITTIPITFEETSDGEYSWKIPNSAEVYARVYDNEAPHSPESMNPQNLLETIRIYTGLEEYSSSGVPTLAATQSANDYREGFEYTEPKRMIVREHDLTGQYLHTRLDVNTTRDPEYILENIDG